MNKKKNNSNIGFGDSYYLSCQADDNNLIIFLRSWDEKLIIITFYECIQFKFRCGSFVDNLYELQDESFLIEALEGYYESPVPDHLFKVFAVIDIDDCKIFEVVAESVNVEKR